MQKEDDISMKLWKKSLAGLIGAVLLTALAAGTALAAESRTKITSVSITIDSDIAVGDSGGSVTATANGSNYPIFKRNFCASFSESTISMAAPSP